MKYVILSAIAILSSHVGHFHAIAESTDFRITI